MERNKKIKITIILLAVLLGISLLALGGMLVYNMVITDTPVTVTVPDNLITPDEEQSEPEGQASACDKAASSLPAGAAQSAQSVQTSASSASAEKKATSITLYNKQPEENTPFHADNMFPGDADTKYFRVQVAHRGQVTVHYHADIRPGYEKLAEVLKVKIRLLTTGETMYDGLMRDMPESLFYKLTASGEAVDELYYEITAYLDTSVDNAYQNKDLIADFRWWVEETGNLSDFPKTGDTSNIVLWACIAAVSGCVLIFLLFARRRKEEEENG